MNKLVAIVVLVALEMLISGCGKSPPTSAPTGGGSSLKQAIVGKWKGDLPGGGFVDIVFHSDGKVETYSSITTERTLEPYSVIDENTIEIVKIREVRRQIDEKPKKEEMRHRLRAKIENDTLTLDEVGGGGMPVLKRVK